MQREFVAAIARTKEADIPTVTAPAQRRIIDSITKDVPSVIGDWLNRRMQTQRPGRPDALFDVTPTQAELHALASSCLALNGLNEIVDEVCRWIQDRLNGQIEHARDVFLNELGGALQASVEQEKQALLDNSGHRPNDITRTANVTVGALANRMNELTNWFRSGDAGQRSSMTFAELKIAADGVFETQIVKGLLRTHLKNCAESAVDISPDKVRLCFDLLNEIYANALKFGRPNRASVRIAPWQENGFSGFVFSTPTELKAPDNTTHIGKRYESLKDAIFREGNSGLPKIAAIAASLAGEQIKIVTRQTERAFHVFIPLFGSKKDSAAAK
jgi:hypothetical protein